MINEILALVRRRYRLRVILAAALRIALAVFLYLVLAAWLLDRFRFDAGLALGLRIAFVVALVAMVVVWLVRPLRRRLTNQEIALYIEEHEPSLQAALVSAVEVEDAPERLPSPGLRRRLVLDALERVREVDEGRRIDRRPLRWLPVALAATLALAILVGFAGPGYIRSAARVLFIPWQNAEDANPFAILVEPGNAVIARGGDVQIRSRLRGFESDLVLLAMRPADSAAWQEVAMGPDSVAGGYTARLFDLTQPVEYQVSANGLRSPVFRIEVRDLPYTRQLDLEYQFPGYTGLAPELITDGGDVAALRGTRVRTLVTPTMEVRAGRIILEGRDTIPLAPRDDGRLEGTFQITRNGFYRIELQGRDGPMVPASLDYTIEALDDHPPSVQITRPGRDTRVTSLEEVFIEVQAGDDYGVRNLDLVYSVNGGPEQVVALHQPPANSRKELTAAHTIFLEEFSLDPGDVVSYYARARDGNPFGGPGTTATDIYFLQVRPFDREYREAEQNGMPGQPEDSPQGLSEQQRQIVAATFKAERDRPATAAGEFRENLATITLAQGRLRERARGLAGQIQSRGIAATDSTFAIVSAELAEAATAMEAAERELARVRADSALPPEQQALQHLLRAEAAFREVQVSRGQPQGGGSAGQQSDVEELADLFELENDRLQNQYETVQRGQAEQAQRQLDEVMERLKELAARQQLENQRMQREAERMQQQQQPAGSASGGGASQRRLAAEADSLIRRLERLTREQPTPDLQESLRNLREAADAMRRSATQPGASRRDAERAMRRLEEARRTLERGRADRIRREAEGLAERARQLAEEQRAIAGAAGSRDPTDLAGRRRLEQRKDRLADDLAQLKEDLDQAARDARGEQPDAARRMQAAGNQLRDRRVEEKIRYSRGLLNSPEVARPFEEGITSNLDDLSRQLAEAAGAIGESNRDQAERTLDRLRQLGQAMESMAERAEENRGEPGGRNQQPPAGGQQPGGQARPQGQPGADPRQGARELRARMSDLQQLRRDLQREGVDPGDLDRIMGQMQNLGQAGDDAQARARLLGDIVQGLKDFEFALRRQLLGETDTRPRAGRPGEVPAGYRDLVDRYYESLSE